MAVREFDVIFIGGGGAAYPGAFLLAEHGKHVLMVDEKGNIGGDCLYAGCIPSKTIRNWIIKHAQPGSDPWPDAVSYKEEVQRIRYENHQKEIDEHRPNLEFLNGVARIVNNHTVSVAGEEKLEASAKYIVIASGSNTLIPPFPGAELCLSSSDLYAYNTSIRSFPSRLAIIGGGFIGVELASLGKYLKSEIYLIEAADRLLPSSDPDISMAAAEILAKNGIRVYLNSHVTEIRKTSHGKMVIHDKGEVEVDEVLMAIGRRPHIDGLGLENTLVQTEGGAIVTSPALRTHDPTIFAAGDVLGKSMLFHSAVKESVIVAMNILAGSDLYTMNFTSVPFTIFTYPELSNVGLSETEAHMKGIQYDLVNYDLFNDAQSEIEESRGGWIRILIEPDTKLLLGAKVFAHNAASLISPFALAIENHMTASQLAHTAFPHPLTFEAITYSLGKYF